MTDYKTSYTYQIEVPAIAEEEDAWLLIYSLPIRTIPINGDRVCFRGEGGDECYLLVKDVVHFITPSSEEFLGMIDASHLDENQSKVMHNILREMGIKAHSMK